MIRGQKQSSQIVLWWGLILIMLAGCHMGGSKDSSHTKTASPLLQCHTQVRLQGTIEQKTFPGPPNYDDITKNPEDYWILKLKAPIDVAMDPDFPAPDENKAPKNVREIQLVLNGEQYNRYRQFFGTEVVVKGGLWQGYTVHHKTAVLMEVEGVEGEE